MATAVRPRETWSLSQYIGQVERARDRARDRWLRRNRAWHRLAVPGAFTQNWQLYQLQADAWNLYVRLHGATVDLRNA